MERHHRATLTLFSAQPFEIGVETPLDEAAGHHAQVRRVRAQDPVRIVDGQGRVSTGVFAAVERRRATVTMHAVASVERPERLELVVPVADRDHMLLAAEKAVELQVTGWHPVRFARSRSVGTRGEGDRFREKLLARMQSALEQCGGAWLPAVHAEGEPARTFADLSGVANRFLLEAAGAPLAREGLTGPVAIAVGPEGGFEPDEVGLATSEGWSMASLGFTTLRFETALIAGAAVVRALQFSHGRPRHGE